MENVVGSVLKLIKLLLIDFKVMENIHISEIRGGDAILHNGEVKTVSNCDIKEDAFMGRTIFGDSYNLGYKKVIRVHFNRQ